MRKKVVTLGEIMLRLSTMDDKRIIQSNVFAADYGGGEANVAISLSNFGLETSFVSKIPNNPLGESVLRYLKANGVNTENIILGGERLGTYYLEVGTGVRNSSVVYDRKYSSFSTLTYDELNLEKILDNTKIIHLSGITPALSKECQELTFKILKKAKEMDILVSFDFNYRGKLWTVEEAGKTIKKYLPFIDICFAGILDAKFILGISLDESKYNDKRELLKAYYDIMSKENKNIKYFISTQREIHSVDENSLTGFIYNDNKLYSSRKYKFKIVDRVGGGDAFAAGALYGIYENYENEKIVEFATGASVLKHTIKGDANLVSTSEVLSFIENGVGKISR